MSIKFNIKYYYQYSFFKQLTFWLPIWVLFFLTKDINFTQIMFFSVTAATSQIIFEVPSGVFADFYGRNKTLTLSAIFKVISTSFFLIGNSFVPYLIGWSFFGISLAFESGTNSAFIYDTLRDLKREKDYKKIQGRAWAYGSAAMAIGSLFGGFLAQISYKTAIAATLIPFILAVFISLRFTEPKHKKEAEDKKYFKHLQEAAKFCITHKRVRWLIIFTGIMMTTMIISHRFSQPYMQLANINIKFFGIIYFVWLMFSALSAHFAHHIEAKLGEFYSLLIIPLIVGIYLLIIGKYVFVIGIAVILIGQFPWGFLTPIVTDYINKHVSSHNRATVLSLDGFFQSILLILISPIFGYIADFYSFTTALIIDGIFALVLGIPIVFIIFKAKKFNKAQNI